MLSILFQKLRFTRTNGRCRFFENGKAKEGTSVHSLDVQELTKSNRNKNAKKSQLLAMQVRVCRRLEISRVNDIPLGRFTTLSAA